MNLFDITWTWKIFDFIHKGKKIPFICKFANKEAMTKLHAKLKSEKSNDDSKEGKTSRLVAWWRSIYLFVRYLKNNRSIFKLLKRAENLITITNSSMHYFERRKINYNFTKISVVKKGISILWTNFWFLFFL